MFWKKMKVKQRPLDGCCSKDEQIEIYRTLYAKAAKERDEASAAIKTLNEQRDQAIRIAKDTLALVRRFNDENTRLLVACLRAGLDLDTIAGGARDWTKEDPRQRDPAPEQRAEI